MAERPPPGHHAGRTPRFAVEVHHNEHLHRDADELHAVVTVTSSAVPAPPAAAAGRPDTAVVVMVDCSGSMNYPPDKLAAAREATAAAVDALPDGVAFALVRGTHRAAEIHPGGGRTATATPAGRAAAKAALASLTASGGTALGSWLTLADALLAGSGARMRHAVLLTDGRNEHESPERLDAVLDHCAGRFTCDARGIGTDWEVAELRGIASRLLGTADIVAEPAALAADFAAMIRAATGRGVSGVALRLWTPGGVEPVFVKQVAPAVADLTGRRADAGPGAGDYPTGSWGVESRDYHLCLRVPAGDVGQDLLAGRVSLVTHDPRGATVTLGTGDIRAVRTAASAARTAVNAHVAHYTGQSHLAAAIEEGLDLRHRGDERGATARLGAAVRLAHRSGNAETARLLAKVVDVEDAVSGTVRLKATVSDADEMTLATRSDRTVRTLRGTR
ncbi:vWA domain-containing protein [Streptomyces lonarensis]|uniref:VWA domain-containing protein n=1 Tax=Streptomyces lonarensis TaxID=700599 RepID=A0A7X6I018_9ACTN|nr:VWA domain-containing protein [Streptomyces lonarensis]NJQ07228.1 VWA domain-containing protein [Streptomyces lonarensis]